MGMLIEGRWTNQDRFIKKGAYVRAPAAFGRGLSADAIDAIGAEPGRFHLVASLGCPWSNRAMIARRLKGIERAVPLRIAGGARVEGYAVAGGEPWPVPGTGERTAHVHRLYTLTDPAYTGRVTVPVLWDSRARRIASNESAAIVRAFDAVRAGGGGLDFTLVPDAFKGRIDRLNARIDRDLSNGVYRAGFARSQGAYDEAVARVFAMLDRLERRLAGRRYLFGATVTETDWRLLATLVRFDAVYHVLFRCSRRRLVDYPNLWAYARDLHSWRGVAETVDMEAIRRGAYENDGDNNPHRIVAVAPDADWWAAHGRAALGPARLALRTGEAVAVEPTTLAAAGGS